MPLQAAQHGEQLAGRQGRRLQRSCQPLPRYSSTATAHHKCQKTMGFPGLVSTSSSRSTSLPAPHQGKWKEEPPPGLIPLGRVMQNTGQQKNQLAPDWDMVVGCRRKASSYLQLLFDAQRLGSMEMKAGLWGCEEERAMSHVKAVCWSWRDVPTNVQARCRTVAHLGSKG